MTEVKADIGRTLQDVQKLAKGFVKDFFKAVEKTADEILKTAKRYVPVDTGRLRDSGYKKVEKTTTAIKCRIGFNTAYAVYVHEDLSKQHMAPTQAKFLERAVAEVRKLVTDAATGG